MMVKKPSFKETIVRDQERKESDFLYFVLLKLNSDAHKGNQK